MFIEAFSLSEETIIGDNHSKYLFFMLIFASQASICKQNKQMFAFDCMQCGANKNRMEIDEREC